MLYKMIMFKFQYQWEISETIILSLIIYAIERENYTQYFAHCINTFTLLNIHKEFLS